MNTIARYGLQSNQWADETSWLCSRVTRHGGSVPRHKAELSVALWNFEIDRIKSVNHRRIATEAHYRVLIALKANPNLSQRQLANKLGISVGKVNYCIRALIDKGWVKARNFRNSDNKRTYAYALTPNGVRRKAELTVRFLEQKRREFEELKREIALLSAEIDD